jgi:hypothetical protein
VKEKDSADDCQQGKAATIGENRKSTAQEREKTIFEGRFFQGEMNGSHRKQRRKQIGILHGNKRIGAGTDDNKCDGKYPPFLFADVLVVQNNDKNQAQIAKNNPPTQVNVPEIPYCIKAKIRVTTSRCSLCWLNRMLNFSHQVLVSFNWLNISMT